MAEYSESFQNTVQHKTHPANCLISKLLISKYRDILLNYQMLTVCSYHVTCTFQSESTLYSCLNAKELLAWSRRDTWSLSGSNGIWTHSHLFCKQTLNHLAKLSVCLNVWLFVYKLNGCDFEFRYCHKPLSLAYKMSTMWLVEKSTILGVLDSRFQCCTLWLKKKSISRTEKQIYYLKIN